MARVKKGTTKKSPKGGKKAPKDTRCLKAGYVYDPATGECILSPEVE